MSSPPDLAPTKPDRLRLALLALGHAVTDTYAHSLLAPLYPELRRRLGLSLVEIGGLPVLLGLTASLAQPLLGWLSDRYPRLPLVALGPLAAALFIGSIGRAESYWQLGLLLFLAGIGIGAYHPQGAALARLAGRGSGLAMSAFTVGGNIGYGLAPLLGMLYGRWFGLDHFLWAAVPAAVFAAIMLPAFYSGGGMHRTGARKHSGGHGAARPWALAALTATVIVRSAVQIGMITFLPFLVEARFPAGARPLMVSGALSAFLLASAVAGPLGGHLADRYGHRWVMSWSFLLAPWPLLLALNTPGVAMIALLAVGGFILMLPHPSNVLMAQELLPRSAGIGASLITGLAAGIAQLLAMPLGRAADLTSPATALGALSLLPLLGVLLLAPIPDRSANQLERSQVT